VTKIHWKRWGRGPAIGHGRYYNAGSVGNPGERFGPVAAQLKFSHVVHCQGQLWYSRFKITYGGGHVYRNGFYETPCSFERSAVI
jgi:hypothetical protein